MGAFTIYPAIDLRKGLVVRLREGDPAQQTTYGADPARIARRWLEAGAGWLHVVNLDGALDEAGAQNFLALHKILAAAKELGGKVQFGGGLRRCQDIEQALEAGVERVLLGTAAVESPELVKETLACWGAERVGAALDARQGRVQVHGWVQETQIEALKLGQELFRLGMRIVIFTNIARDGTGAGADIASAQELIAATGLQVIASGGVRSLEDVVLARQAGLAGIIIGRALYEGAVKLEEALRYGGG